MSESIQVNLTEQDIEEVFLPYIEREVDATDPDWVTEVQRLKRIERSRYWKDRLYYRWKRTKTDFRASVENTYEHVWSETPPEIQLKKGHVCSPIEWNGRCFFGQAKACSRVHLLGMADIIKQLKPKRVLEFGAGSWQNLFWLSALFPEIQFDGVELTQAGVHHANRIAGLDRLPDSFDDYLLFPPEDLEAHKRVNIWRGSADKVEKEDKSYDLVFSRLALEQMEMIRHEVLAEMSRLSTGYVLMVESFKDFNNKGIRLHHNTGSNYFQSYISDLPNDGMIPVTVFTDWPNKVIQKPVLVLVKVNG